MGINFPDTPTTNQLYPQPAVAGQPVYRWDGEKWTTLSSSISDGVVRYDVAQSLNSTQIVQARTNLYAAPFDALAYNGMQVNGSCEVSQQYGTTSFAVPNNAAAYVQDGWMVASFTTGALRCQATPAYAIGSLPGYTSCVAFGATTAQASLGAGDFVYLKALIEGYRISRLAWGTTSAQPISIGFWVNASIAGTMSVSIFNAAANRNYVANIVINNLGTWEYKTLTIPGDTTGTWNTGNGIGLDIRFCFGTGTTYQGAANTWSGSTLLGTSSTTNFMAATNNSAYITGLIILPGIELPSASRAPFIMRPADQELLTCKRYYNTYSSIVVAGYNTTSAAIYANLMFHAMRAAPTIAFNSISYVNASGLATDSVTVNSAILHAIVTTGPGNATATLNAILDSRL